MSSETRSLDLARLWALLERLDPTAAVCQVPGCSHAHGPHAAHVTAAVARAA